MPLRLCSILGTLLLALAVATPVLAQGKGKEGSSTTAEGDSASDSSSKKTSKKKGKRKSKKEKEEEKAAEEAEAKKAEEEKAAAATAASADAAAPEPDAWEKPPAEEEKPPAAAAGAKPAVEKPDHGGKPLSAGLIVGWGFETDRRSASFSADPYALGAGVRGGYSFDFNLYAGVYFMYYLGSSVTGSSQYVANPTITTNANYMQFGAEAGYDWWVGPVIVRPSLQLGMAMAFHDVPNIISPINDFMFAPGVTVVHPWDDYFIGGDLRANVVTGDGTSSLLLAGTFGMRF
jgi:hypothetical protein